NWAFLAFAAAAHIVGVSLHGDQIHHTLKVLLAADGNLHRHHLAAKGFAQACESSLIVGALAVHPAHHNHAREIDFIRVLPDFVAHLSHAGDSVDHDPRSFGSHHRKFCLVREHGETWSVEQIDLGVAPFHRGHAGGDGHLPVNLFFVVVSQGGTVVHS